MHGLGSEFYTSARSATVRAPQSGVLLRNARSRRAVQGRCRPSEVVLEVLPNPRIGTFRKEDGEVIKTWSWAAAWRSHPTTTLANDPRATTTTKSIRIVGRKDVLEQAVMANGSLVPRGAVCSLAKRICLNIACAPCICMRL